MTVQIENRDNGIRIVRLTGAAASKSFSRESLPIIAQAIDDGHEVSVFFAGSGTRLLSKEYIGELNREMGPDSTMVSDMLNKIFDNAVLYCSFASVKATLGHSEGDGALNIADDKITWSGPPGVIKLATNSDVQLTY